MSEILVLNAGSSTLKFSLFASAQTDSDLDLICGGAIEGIGAESGRFRARDKNGEAIADKTLLGLRGPLLSHDGALERLGGWLEERSLGRALSAVGHRVAHGGEHLSGQFKSTKHCLASSRPWCHWHRCINLTIWPP